MIKYSTVKNSKFTIVWTGSSEGTYQSFYYKDIQCEKRNQNSYGSSKYLILIVSDYINSKYESAQSFVVNPNTVASPMSREITPAFMFPLICLISFIFRFIFDIKHIISSGFLAASVHHYIFKNSDNLNQGESTENYVRFDSVSINNRTSPTIKIERIEIQSLDKDKQMQVMEELESLSQNIN